MSKNFAVAVLDIGTTGVRMLVGRIGENGTPKIIAKADAVCRGGIKRIHDYDRGGLPDAIAGVVDAIKAKTGLEVRSSYVSLRNDSVVCVNNTGKIGLGSESAGVTGMDVGELLNEASAIDFRDDERLIDVIPLAFYADGKALKESPEGVSCKTLSVDANVVIAKTALLEKLERIMKDIGLEVDGYVPEFFAARKVLPSAYFNRADKSACRTLVADVGGEFTEYTVYYSGIPFAFGSVNAGGASITKDLSIVLNISQNEAERLKQDYPIASAVAPGSDVEVAIFPLEKGEKEMVNVSYVVEIMQARIREITENVMNAAKSEMSALGIPDPQFDRIILIGDGIARFSGVAAALEQTVGEADLEVINIGKDIGMKNTYSVATGMLLYISSKLKYGRKPSRILRETVENKEEPAGKNGGVIGRMGGKFKNWLSLFKE